MQFHTCIKSTIPRITGFLLRQCCSINNRHKLDHIKMGSSLATSDKLKDNTEITTDPCRKRRRITEMPFLPQEQVSSVLKYIISGKVSQLNHDLSQYDFSCYLDYHHTSENATFLMIACKQGHEDVVRILLNEGANVHIVGRHNETALTISSSMGRLEIVKLLLDYGAEIDWKVYHGQTAVLLACSHREIEVVKLLIDRGADLSIQDESNYSGLTYAAINGHVEMIDLFLDKGVNINHVDDEGYTPLMHATKNGHIDAVRRLLERGADVCPKGKYDNDAAILIACRKGYVEIVKTFLDNGCAYVEGALDRACVNGHMDIVALLIAHGVNIDAQNDEGETALIRACRGSHIEVVRLLLNAGANINAQNNEGKTALMLCLEKQDKFIYLLKCGADVNIQDNYGNTVMHFILDDSEYKLFSILISLITDYNIHIPNKRRQTVLSLAEEHKDKSYIRILKQKGIEEGSPSIVLK